MDAIPLTELKEGKTFPFPVPPKEGVVMGLWEAGPVIFIQKFRTSAEDKAAFRKGFDFYSYQETKTPIPVAVWAFDFPEPFGIVDAAFNAQIARKEWLTSYLNTQAGGILNAFYFFLLDGKILQGSKMVGLDPEVVVEFHSTIRRQLQLDYTQEEFNQTLKGIFQLSPRQLFEQGRIHSFEKEPVEG